MKIDAAHVARIVVSAVREYMTRQRDAMLQETRAAWTVLKDDLSAVRERVAVVEVTRQVPGPSGAPGRDGVDGIGFDDVDLVTDDARKGCFLRFMRGEQVKEFRLPTPYHAGPYHPGDEYYKGNVVSWDGSEWIAKAPTTDKPGDGATAWRLTVKRGKNGNHGKDGPPGPQGPRGDNWDETFDKTRRR